MGTGILIVFPILDWLGVNYVINTLVGLLLGASLNYVISDRVVFKAEVRHSYSPLETEPLPELFHPERLVSELRPR